MGPVPAAANPGTWQGEPDRPLGHDILYQSRIRPEVTPRAEQLHSGLSTEDFPAEFGPNKTIRPSAGSH